MFKRGATADLGIIMASLTLSGLGVKFSSLILSVGQGNFDHYSWPLLPRLLACNTTTVYIIMSILAAPSLIQLGFNHYPLIWLAVVRQSPQYTGPCGGLCRASIAGGHPMKTGLNAVPLGLFMYILPFFFVYEPAIFVYGQEIAVSVKIVASLLVSICCFAAGFQGWLFRNLRVWERAIFFMAAPLLVHAGFYSDLLGYLLVVVMAVYTYRTAKQANKRMIAV